MMKFEEEIARRILSLFYLSQNISPIEDCEVKKVENHSIWTMSACVPLDTDIEKLQKEFLNYLKCHNSCLTSVKFGFYDCRYYPCTHCGGKHLYLSIYR